MAQEKLLYGEINHLSLKRDAPVLSVVIDTEVNHGVEHFSNALV